MTEPAAGWYHDPADAGAWRWWDGATWTDHVRPMTEAALASAPAAEAPANVTPISAPPAEAYQPVPTHAPVFEQIAPAPAPAPAPATGPALVTGPAPVTGPATITPQAPVAEAAAPAAPASAPVTVPPSTIPQPGQVAPSPPAAGGSVRMTPETPVSDQLYWHSSAAEVIEVPRHHNPTTSTGVGPNGYAKAAPSYVRDWNDLGSPNTPGIWLLATSPISGAIVSVAVQLAMLSGGLSTQVSQIAALVASVLLLWVFAALDARALADRGYHPPRIAWMLLLPPLFYFIARGKVVRRESKPAWPAELVFILLFLGVGAFAVLSALAVYATVIGAI